MKRVWNGIWLFLLVVCVGFTFNILAFLLPQDPIHAHIQASIESFRQEGQFPQLIYGCQASMLDNNSDAWILLMCDYDGDKTLIEKALGGYYKTYLSQSSEMTGIRNLTASADMRTDGTADYARYWHGWLFFIRFSLIFMSYSEIRLLNMIMQLLLTGACFVLLERKKLSKYSFAFAIALSTIVPIATCNLRRAAATGAFASGRSAEPNGHLH